ncbi:MAG: hypothetical protein ACWA5U_00470 [bacterium]
MALPSNAAQIVTPKQAVMFVAPNDTLTSQWLYGVSAPDSHLTAGLGLRIHYNAKVLKLLDTEALIGSGVQPFGVPQADLNDWDNDPETDTFIVVAWLDFAGKWPNLNNLPSALFQQLFQVAHSFQQSTQINLTASSTAADALFSTQSQSICRKPMVSLQPIENENTSVFEGESITLTVQLDQALPLACGDLIVDYTLLMDAQHDEQHKINIPNTPTLIIPAGQQSARLTLQHEENHTVEPDSTMTLQLQANTYTQLAEKSPQSQRITLRNNDSAISLQASALAVSEAHTHPIIITLTRTGYLGKAFDVSLSLGGSAIQHQDYTVSQQGRVSLMADQTAAQFSLMVIDDTLVEGGETITLSVLESSAYQRAEPQQLVLSLNDNDEVCFDVDGNGHVDALTDGITLARYLLGLRGAAMIQHSLAPENRRRDNAAAITTFIDTYLSRGCYDIDGNQHSDALTDGVLLLRYLSDYQDEALIQHALGQHAKRRDAPIINQYLQQQLAPLNQ